MDEQDPLDERLIDSLASDEAIDTAAVFTDVVHRGQRRRLRRRVVMGASTALILATSAGAVAVASTGTDRIHVQSPSATSISSSVPTTTSTTTATITTSPPLATGTTVLGPGSGQVPGASQPGSSSTTTTTPTGAPSPWPDGTYLKADHLIYAIAFDPSAASLADTVRVTATITNPDDNWVFVSLSHDDHGNPCVTTSDTFCNMTDLGVVLGRDASGPYIMVLGGDPTLKHQTAQGEYDGLLLAPHASYEMSAAIALDDGRIGELQYETYPPPPNAPAFLTGQVIFHCGVCFGNQYTAFGTPSEQNAVLTVLPLTTSTTTAPN
jgi:hypothetical protein